MPIYFFLSPLNFHSRKRKIWPNSVGGKIFSSMDIKVKMAFEEGFGIIETFCTNSISWINQFSIPRIYQSKLNLTHWLNYWSHIVRLYLIVILIYLYLLDINFPNTPACFLYQLSGTFAGWRETSEGWIFGRNLFVQWVNGKWPSESGRDCD